MKILFTTFSYYPETSGVPIVVQYLAEGLTAKGHEVSVVTRMNGRDLPEKEIINNVQVFRFDIGQDLFKRNVGDIKSYIDFVISYPKDVLILECVQCHTTDILLPFLKQINCKKVLHTHGAPGISMKPLGWEGDVLHTIGHTHNWMRWKNYYSLYFPKFSSEIDAGICLSLCASDIDYLSRHIKKVFILENAANNIFFEEDKYKIDVSDFFHIKHNRYILNISNYSDRKNQLLLMKAFKESGVKDVSLVLIGSKPNQYYEKCMKYAKRLKDENNIDIVLLYGIDRKYFPAIIHNADLFVMTSKWEEYPVSLVEAMSVGTPFLSTPVGNAHILPGGVTSRCDDEIPSLLKAMLNNTSILERFGQQGKKYAMENNTLVTVVENFNKILKSLF